MLTRVGNKLTGDKIIYEMLKKTGINVYIDQILSPKKPLKELDTSEVHLKKLIRSNIPFVSRIIWFLSIHY